MAFIRRAFQRGIAKRRLISEKEIDRVKGALTLLEVGKQDSIERLIDGLDDPAWNVRNACSMAIAQVYEKKPNDQIVQMLHEELPEAALARDCVIVTNNLPHKRAFSDDHFDYYVDKYGFYELKIEVSEDTSPFKLSRFGIDGLNSL